jgi:hypothetical protein
MTETVHGGARSATQNDGGLDGRMTFGRADTGGVEYGERNLSLIKIEKIATAFEISLSELFRGL